MTRRDFYRNRSNNAKNTNKNVCVLAVASVLRVDSTVHYLHTWEDLLRATRNSFTVRSRFSQVKGKSIGAARAKMAAIAAKEDQQVLGFLVGIEGHVLFCDAEGRTVVDTDPRKRDRRKVTELAVVMK